MKNLKSVLRRPLYGALAAVVLAVAVVPAVFGGHVNAAQVSTRSIKMSSSTPSAATSTYLATFTTGPTYTIKGIVLDFCTEDPFVDSTTCTKPAGFNAGSAATTSLAGFATVGSLFSGGAIYLTDATGVSVNNTTVTVTATNVTNPSTACTTGSACTFYARLTTWLTTAGASSYAHGATGYQDYGGFALSTATAIAITAKVMESLSFCVYLASGSCGTAPTFTLGHGSNTTLDTTAVDTKDVKFDISTNALTGAVINLKGDTLKAGTNSIAAAGASAVAISNGSGLFGLSISTAGTGITKLAPYNGSGTYGLDVTSGTNVTSTYGMPLANTTSLPVNASTSTITYAASAATTTPAGIYTATHQLIATGTF